MVNILGHFMTVHIYYVILTKWCISTMSYITKVCHGRCYEILFDGLSIIYFTKSQWANYMGNVMRYSLMGL